MRQSINLSTTFPAEVLNTSFETYAIQFSNPTSSPIAFRQGGTDFPSLNSADFIIPAQTLLRLPAVGRNFAFAFTNTQALALGAITSAKITAFDQTESLSSIGSVQSIARPQWYESERHPSIITGTVVNNPFSFGAPLNTTLYTVPQNRNFHISLAVLQVYTITAGQYEVVIAIDDISGRLIYMSNKNAVAGQVERLPTNSLDTVLPSGLFIALTGNDITTVPPHNYQGEVSLSIVGTEFDV